MTPSLSDIATLADHFSLDLDKPVLSVLDNLCCYEVSGEDACEFLQGQFSNDIKEIDEQHAQLTAYCTPKGRMLATFFVSMRNGKYLLVTSSDLAENVMKRLQMYVMRSKVSISLLEKTMIMGLSNDKESVVSSKLSISKPENAYRTNTSDECICIKIPGIEPRYLLLGEQNLLTKVEALDHNQVYFYTCEYWQWLDVLAGMPMVTTATQEAFVPQMANMELIDGVSFSKGCYPGQEVVARLHYLGNANRRMFRVALESELAIKAGDDIYSSESSQPVGKFLTTIKVNTNSYSGLAILRIEAAKEGNTITSPENGDVVSIENLPYDVPTELKEKNK